VPVKPGGPGLLGTTIFEAGCCPPKTAASLIQGACLVRTHSLRREAQRLCLVGVSGVLALGADVFRWPHCAWVTFVKHL